MKEKFLSDMKTLEKLLYTHREAGVSIGSGHNHNRGTHVEGTWCGVTLVCIFYGSSIGICMSTKNSHSARIVQMCSKSEEIMAINCSNNIFTTPGL